jgi:hypothetical protein
MTFCDGVDKLLAAAILLETLLDFTMGSPRPLQIAFIYHDDIGEIEHDDLLQLQSAAVIGIHHQHGEIDDTVGLERHRFLSRPDGFDNDIIET